MTILWPGLWCVWALPNPRLCRLCPLPPEHIPVWGALPCGDLHSVTDWRVGAGGADSPGQDCSLDRQVLLAAWPILCQEQHPHHCLSIGAPAYSVVFLLFWFADACVHVPRGIVLLLHQTHWWKYFHHPVWCSQYLLCCEFQTSHLHALGVKCIIWYSESISVLFIL